MAVTEVPWLNGDKEFKVAVSGFALLAKR